MRSKLKLPKRNIFIIAVIFLVGIFVFLKVAGLKPGKKTTQTSSVNQYLGYEPARVSVANFDEVNEQLFLINENWATLAAHEEAMYQASQAKNVQSFFENYRAFNSAMGQIVGQTEAIVEFYDKADAATGLNFIPSAYAKKRWSWRYWIPIYGSLVKAKHKSIETARAGIYQYLTSPEVEEIDKQRILKEYGLKSTEDLRTASDALVEKLSRDPELRTGIDWTKITTDLAETAVTTTVEGIKMVTGGSIPNPVKDTYNNAVADIEDGELDSIDDQMPEVKSGRDKKVEKRVSFGLKKSILDKIDEILGRSEGQAKKRKKSKDEPVQPADDVTSLSDIPEEAQDEIIDAINQETKESGPIAVTYSPDEMENKNAIKAPPGIWDFVLTTVGTIPIPVPNVKLEEGKVTRIIKPTLSTADNPGNTGAEIALAVSKLYQRTAVNQTNESPDPSWWDGSNPSCPFIYVKKQNEWKVQNDLISVARAAETMPEEVKKSKQYTDYMTLGDLPDPVDNKYRLRVKEVRDEVSYIDQLAIWVVDHNPELSIANDLKGNVWAFRQNQLQPPKDAPEELKGWDDNSLNVYHHDVLSYDFSHVKPTDNSILVIRFDGFEGIPEGKTFTRPKLYFRTQDSTGAWIDRDFVYPREFYTSYALNTKGWFDHSYQLRIKADSCHQGKYHRIDYIGIDPDGAKENIKTNLLELDYPVSSGKGADIKSALKAQDDNYYSMSHGSWFEVAAPAKASTDQAQTLVVETTGYYVVLE